MTRRTTMPWERRRGIRTRTWIRMWVKWAWWWAMYAFGHRGPLGRPRYYTQEYMDKDGRTFWTMPLTGGYK